MENVYTVYMCTVYSTVPGLYPSVETKVQWMPLWYLHPDTTDALLL